MTIFKQYMTEDLKPLHLLIVLHKHTTINKATVPKTSSPNIQYATAAVYQFCQTLSSSQNGPWYRKLSASSTEMSIEV